MVYGRIPVDSEFDDRKNSDHPHLLLVPLLVIDFVENDVDCRAADTSGYLVVS
jgi:hypothetical protein